MLVNFNLLKGLTYLGPQEPELLARYAALARFGIIEIGPGYGGSTSVLLANSAVQVTSIDSFEDDPTSPDVHSSADLCIAGVLKAVPDCIERWRLITARSQDYAPLWENPFDLIFVDGSHTYDDVRADVEGWLPKLDQGGFMILHDCREGWDGPHRVAQELEQDERVHFIERVFSMTVWRKV